MKIKMGSVTAAMALMVMVMSWSVLQRAEAQGTVNCTSKAGWGAPFEDANLLVQTFREMEGVKCNPVGDCTANWNVSGWNAVGTVCSTQATQYCYSCEDLGNYLNQILAQCNDNNEVQGIYQQSPDNKFILTSKVCLPDQTCWEL